jgi:hypothetical protein
VQSLGNLKVRRDFRRNIGFFENAEKEGGENNSQRE